MQRLQQRPIESSSILGLYDLYIFLAKVSRTVEIGLPHKLFFPLQIAGTSMQLILITISSVFTNWSQIRSLLGTRML
jgi:hypothetical protein